MHFIGAFDGGSGGIEMCIRDSYTEAAGLINSGEVGQLTEDVYKRQDEESRVERILKPELIVRESCMERGKGE